MTDEIWHREEIDSPCQKICLIHEPSGLCIGCHRSRAEIAMWSRYSAQERQSIMTALPDRASQLRTGRRGRRSGRTPRDTDPMNG